MPTFVPLSTICELVMSAAASNLASLLAVPPAVVTGVVPVANGCADGGSVCCAAAREQSIASVIAANINSGFRRHFMAYPHFVWYEIFFLTSIQRKKEAKLVVDQKIISKIRQS
jgi:hypothetical protein